jgi:hypothetical protein
MLYTLVLLWAAYSTTTNFLELLGMKDTKYETMLHHFIMEHLSETDGAALEPITAEQFQKCFVMGSSRYSSMNTVV